MQMLSSSLSKLALATALSTTLMLGGCGKKNAAPEVAAVKTRAVSDANAMQALTLMGLNESGSGELEWASRSGDKGNYVFTNVVPKGEDRKEGNLGTLELKGVHMDGEQAVFDQIILSDFKALDDDETVVTFKTLSLTEPSPALAAAFADALGGNDDAFDDIEGNISFTAINFTGLKVVDEEGTVNLDSVNFGKSKDGTGVFSINDFNMDMTDDGTHIKMNLGSMDVTGVNIDKYKGIFEAGLKEGLSGDKSGLDEDALKKIMGAMDPYNPDFKDFSLKNFHIDADGLVVNLDSMKGNATRKGDKITMTQTMSPLTITPSKTSKDKGMKKFAEALDTLGYEKLEFTMTQNSVLNAKTDSMIIKDSYIAMKDGFKLSFDYDMVGYKAYMQEALALSGKAESNPMAMLGMLDKLQVKKMRIALKDDSIVDRAFKFAAKEQGGTPADLKQKAKMGLAFLPMMAKDESQQKIAGDLSAALGAWLDKGGSLVINMDPKEPVVIGNIAKGSMTGAFDLGTLGLTITQE